MLIGTSVDEKNVGLLKLLSHLRQDLDLYLLIGLNNGTISKHGALWGHIQWLAQDSITLTICKVYEVEGGYELNSIDGIMRYLSGKKPTTINATKLENFLESYDGPKGCDDAISALQQTIEMFRDKYKDELTRFKEERDKRTAHSEHGFNNENLPSYDVMEKLFFFGADFYQVVSDGFIGVGPFDLKSHRPVRSNLVRLFHDLGLDDIKTDFPS